MLTVFSPLNSILSVPSAATAVVLISDSERCRLRRISNATRAIDETPVAVRKYTKADLDDSWPSARESSDLLVCGAERTAIISALSISQVVMTS